jgi:hypothetical protein
MLLGCAGLLGLYLTGHTQAAQVASGPDPRELPIPRITTAMGTLPGVNELPVREGMPDVMVMNDGAKVNTRLGRCRRRLGT